MTRGYHHGALAEAMLDRALAVVRAEGADRLSLRGVTHDLGVSPSAAYNHFSDKDALLAAVASCGIAALDERMSRAIAAHPGDADEAAIGRFAALGRAYIRFAVDEPHLFRLLFGPECIPLKDDSQDSPPYLKLVAALDELDRRGLLRAGTRDGLDLVVWAATHGTACLIASGLLPADADVTLVSTVRSLVLRPDH